MTDNILLNNNNAVLSTAIERILKARTELILVRRFYGVLLSQVEPVPSRQFPTMATNSRQHFFNPDFICGLTQEEVLGVQAHESEHDARKHGLRRKGRDPVKWNEACDYGINIDLIDQGFKLPKDALLDKKYRGMSAEDIYRSRELDAERQRKAEEQEREEQEKQKPEPSDDADTDGGDDQGDDESADDQTDDDSDETEDADEGEQADEGDDGDEADDEADSGDGEETGDDEGDETSEGDGGGEETDDEADTEGDGDGDEAETEGDEAGGEGDEADEGQASCGDPGGCGEVLDSVTDDDSSQTVEEDRWERIVRQAASMAKAVGQMPGHVAAQIEAANNPPQDWREVFRAWVDQGAQRIETWNRPNRRFAGRGLYLPGSQRDGVNHVVEIIDTSASCDDIALGLVANETQAMLDDGLINKLTVIYCDTRITGIQEYNEGDQIDFDAKGRGGTDMRPAFEYVRENIDDASLIVCFTDMEFYTGCGEEPACPVLFAAHGYPDRVKAHLANAPWNAPGIDVGAH